jgi:Xaa-Pro dipeptidase
MNDSTYANQRKINPGVRPDGTPDDNDRAEIGPTPLAFQEWADAGLTAPNLAAMREFRVKRLSQHVQARDLAGVLVFDPLNIRYATDSTNMQLWNAHNPFRACFIGADGYVVLWDFHGSEMLSAFNPMVREVRKGASSFYFVTGDKSDDAAHAFARDLDSLIRERYGANRRIAVDKIQIHGLRALEKLGLEVLDGEEVMEKARSVKGADEILAMRCAVHACDMAIAEMRRVAKPGMTENDVWSVLHAENIKRGGEWIETRLLSSGQRTNPWFHECGPRVIQPGDILAFDTDLVGSYGICVDISRTWVIGDEDATPEQKRLFQEAHAQVMDNMEMLAPGRSFRDLTFGGRPLPEEFEKLRYSVKLHGVGMCDEWPAIYYPGDYVEGSFEYELEAGMVFCSEAYIGVVGGKDGAKLEEQVLVTEGGFENLSKSPMDERLFPG